MRKVIVWGVIPLLILGVVSCSDDSSDTPIEPTPEIVKGLSGDTYMNTKFGMRISNLPIDTWTVKALGSEGQGLREEIEMGYVPLYHLLLLEPVPADEFIGLGQGGDLSPILDAEVPFIWIGMDYWEGGSFETYNLTENLNSYAELYSAEIESKEFVTVGDATGIQAVLLRGFGKEALTWFAKGDKCVRCEYIAKESEFDKHFVAYQQVVQNIEFMGR